MIDINSFPVSPCLLACCLTPCLVEHLVQMIDHVAFFFINLNVLQGYEKLPDYEAIMTEFLRAVAESDRPAGQQTGYGPATFAACSQL